MAFPKKSELAILPKTESLPKQSLFAFTKYDQLNSDQKEKFLKVIRNKQWQFCNKKRQKLHADIFKQKPCILQYLDKNKKLHALLSTLASHTPIINSEIFHWTTLDNFKSIISHQYFYGNKILQSQNIQFQANALVQGDIKNGDGRVICFCPFLVDYLALMNFKNFRPGLIRLTVDLNQIESKGTYNQFFKLCDFLSPCYTYDVKINDNLQITFQKYTTVDNNEDIFNLDVTIKLDNFESVTINLGKEETIFYGNLYSINYFCLSRLFYIIEKINDQQTKEAIKNYLYSCEENELKKILILFAQSLTIHAEYNINNSLKLVPNLIKEVYLANENRYVPLTNIPSEGYLEAITHPKADTTVAPLPILILRKIFMDTFANEVITDYNLIYHGIELDLRGHDFYSRRDFCHMPVSFFTGDQYFEFRDPTIDLDKEKFHVIQNPSAETDESHCKGFFKP